MANQPDFHRLTESFQTAANEIALLANLPAINDRQVAQTRHNEVVDLIRAVNTRLDRMDQRFDRLERGLAVK
jgi:hypothetical protein